MPEEFDDRLCSSSNSCRLSFNGFQPIFDLICVAHLENEINHFIRACRFITPPYLYLLPINTSLQGKGGRGREREEEGGKGREWEGKDGKRRERGEQERSRERRIKVERERGSEIRRQ